MMDPMLAPVAEELEVVLPSSAGFHCDGECWAELGKAPAVLDFLAAISLETRDWFALGDWATVETLADHELPPMDGVHPIQNFLNLQRVGEYRRGELSKTGAKEFYDAFPTLFKLSNRIYIFQGTHRLAALYANGATVYHGWFLDLDAL